MAETVKSTSEDYPLVKLAFKLGMSALTVLVLVWSLANLITDIAHRLGSTPT